jgi:hypothetical protein
MLSIFYFLINNQSNSNYKKQNSSGGVESNHVVFDNAIAETKNTVAKNNPTQTVIQETLSPVLGIKEPTTSEPNMIFAPSSIKL